MSEHHGTGTRALQHALYTSEDILDMDGGRVVTRWLNDETMEATYSGYLSEPLVQEACSRFWHVAGAHASRFALIDAGAVTGYSPGVAHPGRLWLQDFKAHGGERAYIVAELTPLRMLISALMFAAGAPVHRVGSRSDALERILART